MVRTKVHVRYRKQRGCWEVDARAIGGSRPIFPTEEEAHAHATELLKQVGATSVPLDVDPTITLRNYVARWLPTVEPELEPKTFASYERLLHDHVLQALGALRVRDIRARHLRALLNAKRTAGYAKNCAHRSIVITQIGPS